MARTRTKTGSASQGYVTRYSDYGDDLTYLDSPAFILEHECTDVENDPGRDHFLKIVKRYNNYQELTGAYPGSNAPVRVVYSGLRPSWAGTLGPRSIARLKTLPSDNLLATRVLNGTNPSKPDVDLGVTIAELREAPQLLFRAGSNMLRNGANWFLGYNFGWKPLVNDMLDLLDVPPKIDQRMAYLEKATREGGMRRRTDLEYERVMGDQDNVSVGSHYGLNMRCTRVPYAERRVWGTVRYTPSTITKFPRTDKERLSAARRAAYGLTVDAKLAWELMPWSWLIDYFGTMGDFLSATRNVVGLTPSSVCIMKHTVHRDRYETRTDGYQAISGGTGSKVRETKERNVVPFILPDFRYQPILHPGQLSNLGALAVLKIPKDLLGTWDIPRPRRRR